MFERFVKFDWKRARRGVTALGLLTLTSAALSGCGGGSSSSTPPPPSGKTRWTVLVYMNASNDLQPYSLGNIAQMASVGSDANVNIVVQWKQDDCADCGNPSFVGTHRYLLSKHSTADLQAINPNYPGDITGATTGNTAVLEKDRLPDPTPNLANGRVDMGNYQTLADFVQWGTKTYPADNLAVVIWDHGAGWRHVPGYNGRSVKLKARSLSQDFATLSEIETWQLKQALATAQQPIGTLIIDCSLEGMVEVAYEVKDSAKVLCASEESPPGPGYPYDQWLNRLKASGKDPVDVAKGVFDTFIARYKGDATWDTSQNAITQSVIDLTKMNNVGAQLNAFGGALRTHTQDQASLILRARNGAQTYGQNEGANSLYNDNKDLYHYANLIKTASGAPSDLVTAATNLQNALVGSGGAILYNDHGTNTTSHTYTSGSYTNTYVGQANSFGLAAYIPNPQATTTTDGFLTEYSNLALSQAAPDWAAFLRNQQQ